MSIVGGTTYTYGAVGKIYVNKALVKTYVDKHKNQYAIYSKPAITVIKPTTFSFHFINAGARLKDVVQSQGCSAGLNGTYFGHGSDGSFFPAGVWYEFGSFLRSPYQPANDQNLKVLMASNGDSIDLYDNDTFDFSKLLMQTNTSSWYVNAGPWLVRDGRINADVLRKSSHWQRETTRAGIMRNPDGSVQFIIATQPISLPQFIAFSYGVGLGTGAFQFVNLDGGSSTSLVTPYNSYQPRKNLPSFICIQ